MKLYISLVCLLFMGVAPAFGIDIGFMYPEKTPLENLVLKDAELGCTPVPGLLKQIDAGVGQVYGVNEFDDIYQLIGSSWVQVPGKLIHVTVGPSRVWGANRENDVYKLQDGNWIKVAGFPIVSPFKREIQGALPQNEATIELHGWLRRRAVSPVQSHSPEVEQHRGVIAEGDWELFVPSLTLLPATRNDGSGQHSRYSMKGSLKQVDAGGPSFLVGVNQYDNIYCLNLDATFSKSSELHFNQLGGSLKYCSCGPYSCWGVNNINDVYHRLNGIPENCKGGEWTKVDGKMVMLEVSTDGAVYAINTVGQIYKRVGIHLSNPIGTVWDLVNISGTFTHLSYDNGILWVLDQPGNVLKCEDQIYFYQFTKS